MTHRARFVAVAAGIAAAVGVLLAVTTVLTLRSGWFREKVRQRIVSEVERATGGRSEAASFDFDWWRLRAEVKDFVLHGTEPPDRPPLFRAASIAVGLKIVSALKRDVDIESLAVREPRIYLMVFPDGRTNVPAPKLRRRGKPVMETILDLAVRRFEAGDGVLEIEKGGATRFHLSGRNLRARFGYDAAGPRYEGSLSMRPADFRWGGRGAVPVDVDLAVAVDAGRVRVRSGRFATGATQLEFSGDVPRLAPFEAGFDYQARLNLADLETIAGLRGPPRGEALVAGKARFTALTRYEAAGNLHAAGVSWRQDGVRLRDFRADGAVSLTPERLEAAGLRLAGAADIGSRGGAQPVTGGIERVTVRGARLDASGIRLAAMGGNFHGTAELRDWHRYRVAGEAAGFEARRLLALHSERAPPWNARISGPVTLEGSLRSRATLAANARLHVTPAAEGPPVEGVVNAEYDARAGTVDFGNSYLNLPATRADFSGVLGRELAVRLESRNLDDLLPAVNQQSLPVRLENGKAVFQGTVSGPLADPRIAGHAAIERFAFEGVRFDSFGADVEASAARVALHRAMAARGSVRAEFEAAGALSGWRPDKAGQVFATGSVRGAPLPELLAIAGRGDVPASGSLDAAARVTGTWGAPVVTAEAAVEKGVLYGEPFDRAAATLRYADYAFEVSAGQVAAGPKRVAFQAVYRHAPGQFAAGRLHGEVESNAMALDQIATLRKQRPELTGSVQFAAAGDVDVSRSGSGELVLRPAGIAGSVTASNVAMSGQSLGNARLVAATRDGVLSLRVSSDFAGSAITGDGEWRLAGDYPGKARLRFSRLDFVRLREVFTAERLAHRLRVAGSMEGDVTVEGPMLKPDLWKAAVRVPQVQIGPAPDTALAANGQVFTLRNSGPVTATLAGGMLRLDSARFVGRATDLSVGGTVALRKEALDLRVKGRIDLASLEDLNRDISASGFVNTEAAIRGPLRSPQVNGTMEMRNAGINYAPIPNGIYNANGVIAFTGTRATIQSFTGESGGGKVRVAGFVGYEEDRMLFRLFLRADQVRVRYPEGVSTVANAALNWTGTSERSTVAGTVSIVRTGFNPQTDLSAVLARSAEPVRTPSARTGLLSGLNFDVQIETAPDLTFQSSLAQDIQAEANLRLRGTATNPSLLGRISITQGRLVFFGTRYTINQGSISFFNPVRVEPILNIDLETKARGIDVTLTISGPMHKLNLTPRSDPPLQFNEIIALLTTGRAPTSDPTLLSQQSTAPQTWQQAGASALLGQAIASPVAGRLQRFFGVTRLKIDPTLTGVENNPQARLTLEQQITPNITFTYITNVTSSNPLVVQVEWAVSRKWSVIAVRDENGLFGLDFLYKKRF